MEYGEFNYNFPVLENEKLRNFSLDEAMEFCNNDYINYIEQTWLTWKQPREFQPIPSRHCELVGFNSTNKTRYEIHTKKAAAIAIEDYQAGKKFIAKRICAKNAQRKILNFTTGGIFNKTLKLLSLRECEKLCEKDYANLINNNRERE